MRRTAAGLHSRAVGFQSGQPGCLKVGVLLVDSPQLWHSSAVGFYIANKTGLNSLLANVLKYLKMSLKNSMRRCELYSNFGEGMRVYAY